MKPKIRALTDEEHLYLFDQSTTIKSKSGYIGYTVESADKVKSLEEINWLNLFDERLNESVIENIKDLFSLRDDMFSIYKQKNVSALFDQNKFFMQDGVHYYGVRIDINDTAFLFRTTNFQGARAALYVYDAKELDRHIKEAKSKGIRVIDSHYKTLFKIEDGDQIKMISANGKYFMPTCRYLDEYHLEVGGSCYHICQFAELMEQKNNTVIPIRKSLPDECYIYDADNDTIGILEKGANVYGQVPIKTKNADDAKAFVDTHNRGLDVSKNQAIAMISGYKYGWADKRADPNNYDTNGKFKEKNDKSQEAR